MTGVSRFRLRATTPTDLEWTRNLLARSGLPDGGIEEQFGDGYVVAETGEGERVGVGGIEVYGNNGLLRSVAVAEVWRGRALGRAIVEDRLRWARGRGLDAVYLLTDTAPSFFQTLGFRRVDRATCPSDVQGSKEFSELCPATAVAMVIRC